MGSNNDKNCNNIELLSTNRFSSKALFFTTISREALIVPKSDKILDKENKKLTENTHFNKISENFREKPNKDSNTIFISSKILKNNNNPNNLEKKIKNTKNKTTNSNNIFIFDWDDTLFFASHLIERNDSISQKYLTSVEKAKIKEIEEYTVKILNKALNKGIVFIITNSSEGWVEACVEVYYKELIPLLSKVNIISARTLYEKKFPDNMEMWKIQAFTDLPKLFEIDKNVKTNIICLGDNNLEIKCGKKLAMEFNQCLLKTIKFRENPDLKELIKQLNLIDLEFMRIFNFPKSLCINVDKKNLTDKE